MANRLASVLRIQPVPSDVARPFWSVMIPTYNCDALLEQTIRCVLDQDPGVDQMQIAIVDDRSPNGRSREIATRLAPERIEFHEQPSNIGLAGNWNSCIERSRGRWVHILHQDDLILPGFYDRLGRASVERPDIGAAFCRHKFIDGEGNVSRLSGLEQEQAGLFGGWIEKITYDQRIQCPSIVVKRSVYEQIGGFCPELLYGLDWEMWVRIAFRYPYWYEPEALACWREHEKSETRRLARQNVQISDTIRTFEIMWAGAPKEHRDLIVEAIRAKTGLWEIEVWNRLSMGEAGKASSVLFRVYRHESPMYLANLFVKYYRWILKVWFFRHILGVKPKVSDACGRPW